MRILYATDGSEGAVAAGLFLKNLSLRHEDRIHIVTVTEAETAMTPESLLQSAEALFAEMPATVTTESLVGHSDGAVVAAILAAGEALTADLIVAGESHHSRIAQLFAGDVAKEIAHQASCSVLMVRQNEEAPLGPLKSVVVGVDSAPRSRETALWTACEFPLPPDCPVHLVAVYPAQTWAIFTVSAPERSDDSAPAHKTVIPQTLEEEQRRAEAWTQALAEEIHGARKTVPETRQGTPVDELLHAAEAAQAGLIVVGAPEHKEHGLLDRFFTDSVAERILGHASVAVLFFRPKNLSPPAV